MSTLKNMIVVKQMLYLKSRRLSVHRVLSTSQRCRTQEWQQQGIPGSNLPFPINCKYKLTLLFALFFGSSLNAPFLIARRHLLLANTKEPPVPPQQLTTIVCFDEKTEGEAGDNLGVEQFRQKMVAAVLSLASTKELEMKKGMTFAAALD